MLFKFSQIAAKAAIKSLTDSLAQVSQSSGILPAQAHRLAGASMPSMPAQGWAYTSYPASALNSACSALNCRGPMHHSSGQLPHERSQHSRFQSSLAQPDSSTRSLTSCLPHSSWHGHARLRQVSTSAAAGAAAPLGNDQPADNSQHGTAGSLHSIGKFAVDQFLPLGLLASMALGWVQALSGLQVVSFAAAKELKQHRCIAFHDADQCMA